MAKAKEDTSTKAKADNSDTVQELKNENETLKDKVAQTADPNAKPRTITKGTRVYPKYQKNNTKIAATLPKKK